MPPLKSVKAFQMSEEINQLRSYYERQDTEELLEIAAKDLTEEARKVLNQVLDARGIGRHVAEQVQERVAKVRAADTRLNKLLGKPSVRLVAFLVDAIGCSFAAFLVLSPLLLISEKAHEIGVLTLWWLYMLFRDALPSQSIGKKILKLRVVGVESGAKCTWAQSLWRNLSHFCFFIDALFLLINRRMRLGDMIAGTMVVRSGLYSQDNQTKV
ncbi:MAG: hypothetical protein C4K60_05775 [Ideonella sp. MAG2]|nr:MAG: hypothetical protein C4K60_05775 [Ideonella sp. MAG2]